jgi:transcriptional regulator with XRE-family HTH domain
LAKHAWLTLAELPATVGTVSRGQSAEQALALVLRARREAAGLSQEKVAHRAGISRNYFQALEKGMSDPSRRSPANPSLTVLIDLSHALGISFATLAADVEEATTAGELRT